LGSVADNRPKPGDYLPKPKDIHHWQDRESLIFLGGSDMKRLFAVFMILVIVLAISGCAAGPNELLNLPDDEGKVAGFW
jgi:hypothetical protein